MWILSRVKRQIWERLIWPCPIALRFRLVRMVDADRLMGRAEIEQLLGVGYTRVRVIMSRPSFPRPIRVLTGMKIWDGAEVEQWAATHRKPKLAEEPEGDA